MQDLPKIVRLRLRRTTAEAAEGHPGAEVLTAFAEQSLGVSERSRVMEHLSRCGDCRDVVALALPVTEALPTARPPQITSGAWLSWPVLRWGIVTAGIALVTSVGILQYQRWTQAKAALVAGLVRREEKAVTAPPQSSGPVAQTTPEGVEMETKRTPARKPPQSAANQPSTPPNAIFPAPQGMSRADDVGSGVFRASRIGPAQAGKNNRVQPPPTGPQSPAAQSSPFEASQAVEMQSENVPVVAQDEARGQLAQNHIELPSQKQPLSNLDVVKAKDSVPPQEQSSAVFAAAAPPPNISLQKGLSSTPRWAISLSGTLQRSFDAGMTWEDIVVNQTPLATGARMATANTDKGQFKAKTVKKDRTESVVFRAVAAIGLEVWAGGSDTMLYHSLDSGSHWTRVIPSEASDSLTGDIIGVEFADAQHGKITTSAGEVWMTADDGQNWHKQQ